MPSEENDKQKLDNMETFKEYLDSLYTEQTAQSYKRAVDHFLFHSKNKKHSSYSDIIDYLSQEKPFSSSRDISAIKCYFNYLIETGQREDHPCRSLRSKRKKRDIQFQQLFTPEELELLLTRPVRYSVLENRDKAILSLLIYQALSSANIENLRVEDIDIDLGEVYVRATSRLPRRTLELKPKQVLLLYRYINESRPKLLRNDSNQLFLGKLGSNFGVDTLNRMLRPLQALFPIKNLNATSIRKSVIANWLNVEKIPLEDVQLLSGQKWLSTTEKYIRPNSEDRRGMINQFFPL